MWPDDFARYKEEPANEQVCFVRGAIDPRSQNGKPLLLLTRFLSIEQAQRELTRLMLVTLRLSQHGPEHVEAIARCLRRTPGTCPVLLDVRDPAGAGAAQAVRRVPHRPAHRGDGGAGRVARARGR